jgi:hypothetical protein
MEIGKQGLHLLPRCVLAPSCEQKSMSGVVPSSAIQEGGKLTGIVLVGILKRGSEIKERTASARIHKERRATAFVDIGETIV